MFGLMGMFFGRRVEKGGVCRRRKERRFWKRKRSKRELVRGIDGEVVSKIVGKIL